MAGNAGGEGKNGGGGSERQLKQPALQPEERSLNTYVLGHTYLLMAMTGLGYLALTWSTVVLLGGFVTSLGKKDFWCLTVISMIQAARIFNDLADRLFPNFLKIAGALVRWRSLRDVVHCGCLEHTDRRRTPPEEWGGMLATRYISNERSRCWQNPNSISDRKVIDYAVELLDSESWEDNLGGARMLDAFIRQGADVRSLLLPSRSKVQKLFDTLGWRCGPERNRETREAAVPGSLQCVASLLQGEATAAYLSGKQESRRIKKAVVDHWKLFDTLGWRCGPERNRETREAAVSRVFAMRRPGRPQFPGSLQCVASLLQDEATAAYLSGKQESRRIKKAVVDHFVKVTKDNNNVAHLTELLDATSNITYRTIAAQVLENYCTHCDWNEEHKKIVTELVRPKVITVILSIKSDRPESSDEKEKKPQAKRWTIFKTKNNRGNEANLKTSAPGKDEENPQTIAPGTGVRSQACTPGDKNIVQKTSSLRDQNKSSDRQNEEQTASTKELQEALLSLALVICAKLINAQDVIQEKALGGTPFVVKLKTIVDDNCQPTADSLRIVRLCGYIAASVMSFEPYADCFRNNEFAKSFTKASKIMSNLESCMIFAGTDFGVKKILRPLLSELEKKVSDLEKKEVQLG
ncbi:unnamed protein product [Urochloa decumbens]|uniref:CLASP N-terminal domain-containing protein n=1 Tax=Urochloa decumbens TaxID=240449 RepID=A0ABC9AYR6_9POAL